MKLVVKDFIEQNVELLDANDFVKLFEKANTKLSNDQIAELQQIFIAIDIDAVSLCWNIFEQEIHAFIEDNKHDPFRDESNSCARLDYMLDAISLVGFSWQEAKHYVLTNQNKLNLQCYKLEPQYGWQGAGDYAFQWFDERAFDEEYLQDD